jgi:hypothetical protein
LYLYLSWRETALHPRKNVGLFCLNLPQLLSGGYVRFDPEDSAGPFVRLRIVRDGGAFYIQVNEAGKPLPMQ